MVSFNNYILLDLYSITGWSTFNRSEPPPRQQGITSRGRTRLTMPRRAWGSHRAYSSRWVRASSLNAWLAQAASEWACRQVDLPQLIRYCR